MAGRQKLWRAGRFTVANREVLAGWAPSSRPSSRDYPEQVSGMGRRLE